MVTPVDAKPSSDRELVLTRIIDAPRDRIEVTGTYVPAYALNNAFAQWRAAHPEPAAPQTDDATMADVLGSGFDSLARISCRECSRTSAWIDGPTQ